MSEISDEIFSDEETDIIRFFLEHLYVFYYMKEFDTVRKFFTLSQDDWDYFKKTYKNKESTMQQLLRNFDPQ